MIIQPEQILNDLLFQVEVEVEVGSPLLSFQIKKQNMNNINNLDLDNTRQSISNYDLQNLMERQPSQQIEQYSQQDQKTFMELFRRNVSKFLRQNQAWLDQRGRQTERPIIMILNAFYAFFYQDNKKSFQQQPYDERAHQIQQVLGGNQIVNMQNDHNQHNLQAECQSRLQKSIDEDGYLLKTFFQISNYLKVFSMMSKQIEVQLEQNKQKFNFLRASKKKNDPYGSSFRKCFTSSLKSQKTNNYDQTLELFELSFDQFLKGQFQWFLKRIFNQKSTQNFLALQASQIIFQIKKMSPARQQQIPQIFGIRAMSRVVQVLEGHQIPFTLKREIESKLQKMKGQFLYFKNLLKKMPERIRVQGNLIQQKIINSQCQKFCKILDKGFIRSFLQIHQKIGVFNKQNQKLQITKQLISQGKYEQYSQSKVHEELQASYIIYNKIQEKRETVITQQNYHITLKAIQNLKYLLKISINLAFLFSQKIKYYYELPVRIDQNLKGNRQKIHKLRQVANTLSLKRQDLKNNVRI